MPRWGLTVALAVVGLVLAATFRPSVFPLIAANWLAMCPVVGGTLILNLAVALLLAHVARLDSKTAALGILVYLSLGESFLSVYPSSVAGTLLEEYQ